jgi:hypothetical protein
MQVCSTDIRVAVVFGPGMKVRPVWFDLNRRQHTVRQITNSWKDRKGEVSFLHFHVTDDGALYELVCNMSDFTWRLEHIEAL